MTNMNQKEIYNFLTSGTMTAKISSASIRGNPHVAPVWFVVDGKSNQDVSNIIIVFTTWSKSLKARNLLLNPQVSLCIDDQTPPYSFVIVNGIAEIDQSPDEKELLKYTTRIAERYMGKENAERYGKRNAVPGEFIVKIRPTKIIAQKNVSD